MAATSTVTARTDEEWVDLGDELGNGGTVTEQDQQVAEVAQAALLQQPAGDSGSLHVVPPRVQAGRVQWQKPPTPHPHHASQVIVGRRESDAPPPQFFPEAKATAPAETDDSDDEVCCCWKCCKAFFRLQSKKKE